MAWRWRVVDTVTPSTLPREMRDPGRRRAVAARPLFDRAGEHEPLVLCEGEGDTPDVEVPPLLCQWLRPHQYVTASKINPYRHDAAFRLHNTGARASPSSSSASTA